MIKFVRPKIKYLLLHNQKFGAPSSHLVRSAILASYKVSDVIFLEVNKEKLLVPTAHKNLIQLSSDFLDSRYSSWWWGVLLLDILTVVVVGERSF